VTHASFFQWSKFLPDYGGYRTAMCRMRYKFSAAGRRGIGGASERSRAGAGA